MSTQIFTRILDVVYKATQLQSTLLLWYRRADETPEAYREVEPYSITEGKQGAALLRAYQVKPDPGWRYFLLHHIMEASITAHIFKPRRSISITQDRIQKLQNAHKPGTVSSSCMHAVNPYREMLLVHAGELVINQDQAGQLIQLRDAQHLSDQQMLAAYYSVFNELMHAVLDGSEVTPEEIEQLKKLNESLRKCGAGVLE